MPRTNLSKTIHLYFTKFKRSITTVQSHQTSLSSKDHNRSSKIKTSFSSSTITTTTTTKSSQNFFSSSSSDSESDSESTPPDFATVYASQRFFFSSPGPSNSIVNSNRFSAESKCILPAETDTLINGGIPIQTYSPDPYIDFRRSMQEMVEATQILDVRADWDYLHELLLCYLALNPKNTHKFIVDAFADLLVTLVTTSTSPSPEIVDVGFHHGISRV